MGILKNLFGGFEKKEVKKQIKEEASAGIPPQFYGPVISYVFDGEKNLGEMGPARQYYIDHQTLRVRAWQSKLDSEITKTVIDKFALWVIGSGLKLKSEPMKLILKANKLPYETKDTQQFTNMTESLWHLYSNSKAADYSSNSTLNQIEKQAFIGAAMGGDMLVILRLIKGIVKVQLIDGGNVQSPISGGSLNGILPNGNRIVNGVELNANGEHVAYYVRKAGTILETERIVARGKRTGKQMAFMIYGDKHKVEDVRGVSIIASVMETLSKLERYKEATVGSAEEVAKIVYQIVHKEYSTGENPLLSQLTRGYNADADDKPGQLPVDVTGQNLANTIAATTNKATYNLSPGAELKAVTSDKELYFKDFYITLCKIVCATIGIPYGVAFSDYDGSYSASRAEIKDWQHICETNRTEFSIQFMMNVYRYWLDVQVLQNKIQAPGYNPMLNDSEINMAYQSCRWTGPSVPHIDPLKEVKAVREKLGTAGAHLPLISQEDAIEELGSGDADELTEQFSEELKIAESLGIPIKMSGLPIKEEEES
jgi:lambda family phage portal protein